MKPLLIGLAGRMGAGKDTVATVIKAEVGANHLLFASPLKEICRNVFGFTHEQVYGTLEQKNAPDPRYPRADGTCLSPREAMQVLGTEFGRRCYPNIWVEMAMRRASIPLGHGDNVVISDCRFVNEAKAIREAGGQVWRIRRPSADGVEAVHQSELEMDTPEFNELVTYYILNNGTLEQLAGRVKEALKPSPRTVIRTGC